jgi:hypothetical protein
MKPMKPFIVPLTLCAVAACVATASGQQSAPTMNQEPHHKRLTYVRHMRVFELMLAPGEATGEYVLDHDSAIVALTDATVRRHRGGAAGEPQKIELGRVDLGQMTGEPVTQRLENVGTTPLHAIVVENLRDRGWTMPAAIVAPGTALRQENRSFAVYDMRLNAANRETNHTHQNAVFVFLMSGGVEAQGGGGEFSFPLDRARTWWFPGSGTDQPHTIELTGSGDAHVMCVEAK